MTTNETTLTTRSKRGAVVCGAAAILLSLSVGGCSTSIADLPFGSSDAPQQTKDASEYPAVHDLPAPREEAAMAPAEQAKVEKELIAARDHQASTAK